MMRYEELVDIITPYIEKWCYGGVINTSKDAWDAEWDTDFIVSQLWFLEEFVMDLGIPKAALLEILEKCIPEFPSVKSRDLAEIFP